jgi:hypothetical protein
MKKENWSGLIVIILIVFTGSCGLRTEYGLNTIKSPNGEKFYFRRAARGLNYDTLTLSKNSDYCAEPDPNTTLIFHGLGPKTIFYKFVGDELHIYDVASVEMPRNFSEKVKVIINQISNPQFIAMGNNYKEKGLEKSDVPINNTLFCVF